MPPDGIDDVRRVIEAAEEVAPDFGAAVHDLAALPPNKYDQRRKAEAKRLGVQLGTLDQEVKRARRSSDDEDAREAQREQVIEVGLECDLWCDPDFVAYATVPMSGHSEHWRLRSDGFRRLLLREYGARFPAKTKDGGSRPTAPSDQSYREGLNALEAIACNGRVRQPYVRVGEADGAIYLDLGTPDWSAIEITPRGWRLVAGAPIPFIRPPGMRALPLPKGEDGINRLRALVNMATENDFRLLVFYLVQALRPSGPYVMLVIDGEPGSAKSTKAKLVRRIIDPNKVLLSAKPKSEEDLIIAALNGQVVGFDNISSIDADLADALCRLATGTGLRKRKLYSDDEEILITACRPIIVNGIPMLATRSDFADRSIVLTSPPISGSNRRSEKKFWASVDEAVPAILADLLGGVVLALRDHAAVEEKLTEIPRMADFVCWSTAAAPAFGWTEGDFHVAYSANRRDATDHAIEADAVALAVRDFAAKEKWTGSATELLTRLNDLVAEDVRRTRAWPKGSAQLSGRLRRAAPSLRRVGVSVNLDARHPETRVKQVEIEVDKKQRSQRSERSGPDKIPPVQPLTAGSSERSPNAGRGLPNADPNAGVRGEGSETFAPNATNAPNAVSATLEEWKEEL